MSQPFKPDGYTSVSPYLLVNGARALIDFLAEAFDATVTRQYDEDDGSVLHAEVRIDDSIIMIADAGGEHEPFFTWVHLYVPDVDAAYQQALNAGATSAREPTEQEGDPDRRAGIIDPAGNTWWLATQRPER